MSDVFRRLVINYKGNLYLVASACNLPIEVIQEIIKATSIEWQEINNISIVPEILEPLEKLLKNKIINGKDTIEKLLSEEDINMSLEELKTSVEKLKKKDPEVAYYWKGEKKHSDYEIINAVKQTGDVADAAIKLGYDDGWGITLRLFKIEEMFPYFFEPVKNIVYSYRNKDLSF